MHWSEKLLDLDAAYVVAKSLAQSRGVEFHATFAPDSTDDKIHTEALRAIVALRRHLGSPE
jgi:hypothetical protein